MRAISERASREKDAGLVTDERISRKAVYWMEFIIFAIVFVALIPIVLFFILKPALRERKISNGIRNQDVLSQNYLFKINYSKQEFLSRIEISNVADLMDYTFDNKTMAITFSKYNAKISYTVTIKELENGCYIRLTKNRFIGDRSNIPYCINEFMIKKFDAELLPYEEYKSIVT